MPYSISPTANEVGHPRESQQQQQQQRYHGLDNRIFRNDIEDYDRIDVISTSSSSASSGGSSGHQEFSGSRNCLTGTGKADQAQKLATSEKKDSHGDGDELVELTNGTLLEFQQRLLRSPISPAVASICEAFEGVVNRASRASTPSTVLRRWSQNISRYSREKRSLSERTIYRMPSRKVFEIEGLLLSASNIDPETEIDQLVKEIEQHEYLMEDTAVGEQNRLETLRALPQPLSAKRVLKKKISLSMEQHHINSEERHSWRHRLFNGCMYGLIKLWHFLGIICRGIELWYDSLKTIEGHFGSNVGSYFKFLRWLFVLNLLLFACTICFITMPQILYNASVSNVTSMASSIMNGSSELEVLEESILELVEDANVEHNINMSWYFMDLFSGEGFLKHSLLFYGSYSNMTFTYDDAQSSYSIPHAYYVTMLSLFVVTFVIISSSMARSYRRSFIATSGGMRTLYAQKILCSWDYGITDRKAAELKHFSIYTELKEVLSELVEPGEKLSLVWRLWIFLQRLFAHLLVCAMIAGLGGTIWILLKLYGGNDESHSWRALYVATAVNFSMLFLQWVFGWIERMEGYLSPRSALHISLVRNFLLEAVIIGVLVYYWLTQPLETEVCWETSFGQEIYRLIVSDTVINLLLVPLLLTVRIYVVARFWPHWGNTDFDISQKSLGLVFNQTLLWVGLFFAPLLAALMVVKMVLAFYVNKAMLMHLCKSPRHVWRSVQTHTLYLVFTFLSLLGVIIALGYIMTQVPVSSQCGPFRDYAFMFQILIDGVLKLREHHTAWLILMTLLRPAVVGTMLVIMAIVVYYLRAKSRACCMMVKLLKEMIYLEAKDKEFLLANIANISKDREWLFEAIEKDAAVAAAEDRFATASATWRYTRQQSIISHNSAKGDKVTDCGVGGSAGSRASAKSSSSSLSVSDECALRSRHA